MGIMSRKHAIQVAKYHRDNATSKELRRYWVRVIKGIKLHSRPNLSAVPKLDNVPLRRGQAKSRKSKKS